jgi:hypothetical protein
VTDKLLDRNPPLAGVVRLIPGLILHESVIVAESRNRWNRHHTTGLLTAFRLVSRRADDYTQQGATPQRWAQFQPACSRRRPQELVGESQGALQLIGTIFDFFCAR